jgi:hypothetical protein
MGKYLKAAFLNRWNLLALIGSTTAAMISGSPEIFLPLVLAGETAYLGFVGTHPKFQTFIDVKAAQARRGEHSESTEGALRRILRELPEEARERYEQLRKRCLELRDIAKDLKEPGSAANTSPLDSMRVQGLDRMLWIYLRLLYTQHSLARFLDKTNVDLIYKDIERLENRLRDLEGKEDRPQTQKLRRTLDDNLATCRMRLENYQKGRDNYEFVELEIDRLANKIKSLAEMAVAPHEPDFVATTVDEMAGSLMEAEKAMSELDFATGLGAMETEPPELLEPTREVQENRFG